MTTVISFVHKTSWSSEEGSLLLHIVSARAGPWWGWRTNVQGALLT